MRGVTMGLEEERDDVGTDLRGIVEEGHKERKEHL